MADTIEVPDKPYNPNVEVREVDDREFNDHGQLIGGGVRQVMYVNGEEYKPPTQAQIAEESEKSSPNVVKMSNGGQSDTPIGDAIQAPPTE